MIKIYGNRQLNLYIGISLVSSAKWVKLLLMTMKVRTRWSSIYGLGTPLVVSSALVLGASSFIFLPPLLMAKPQTSLFEGTENDPKPKHLYNKYDLVSFLLKSLRLRKKEDALTAMWALIHEGVPQLYLAKKLTQYAAEDAVAPAAYMFAVSTFQFIRDAGDEVNSLSRLILHLCDCECMWESEKETEWEVRRIFLRERIKQCYERGQKPVELPSHVFDQYTASGKARMKRGEQIDRRVSGVLEGSGLFCRACFLRDKKLDLSKTTIAQAYSPHLLQCAKEGLHVDTYLRKHGITIEDFLRP